jgi:glycosyltransferase involved in cell wall biosynthesis
MRILFLTHRLPYPPNRGDRIRAYYLLRTLAAFHEVEVVSLVHSKAEEASADGLGDIASRVTTCRVSRPRDLWRAAVGAVTNQTMTHALLDAPTLGRALADAASRRPDVVFSYCSGMVRFALEPPLAGLPIVFDMVDVDSEKWSALARTSSVLHRWVYAREGRLLSAFEAMAARRAFATLVVNDRERASIARLAPGARIDIVPNGVDIEYFSPNGTNHGRHSTSHEPQITSHESRIVFTGVMNYPPNAEGAQWLANHVWPLVRERMGDARLSLVGLDPPASVRRLAGAIPRSK